MGRLRRRFGDHDAAYDVIHDVCERLLVAPPVHEVHSPQAFLQRVSVDLAIDRHRVDAGRERLIESAGEDLLDAAPARTPEQATAHGQMLASISLVIDGLPPRCRDVFILHKLHEVPQEEIAARLGISRNMVARHVMRAMQDLRRLLDHDGRVP